ncbi:MAG: molybdopterin-dependent oxidoreductase [Thermoplasmatales archaeon]|nr:MAG: molybdopterin-dependent oxidoreductase [Thermoplasmatales archaeon]
MITINGKKIPFKEGETVLETALEAGIYIPSLCTQSELESFGACRLCLVKIEGMRGFPTSCNTEVKDGMVITTEDDELQKIRRNVLEMLLSEHPNTCIICKDKDICEECHFGPTKAGRVTGCRFCPNKEICEVREVADYLGLEDLKLPFEYKNLPLERDDPFFDRDYNLCILCGRCVRVCQDIRGRGTLAFTQRSFRTKVGTAFDKLHIDSNCGFCGACVDVCPTGALSARGSKWHGDADSCIDSICILCSIGCNFSFESKWDRIMAAIPKREGPTKGQVCSRGRFCVPQLLNGTDRLKQPMIRKNGKLIPVSWDEAITHTADKLKDFKGEEIGVIASKFLTNESAYVLQKFTRAVLNTNNIDSTTSDFVGPVMKTIMESKTANSNIGKIENIENSRWIIVLGRRIFNPSSALNPSIYRAKKKGAKIILIDPGKSKTPRIIDVHLELGVSQTLDFFYGIIHSLYSSNPSIVKKSYGKYGAFVKSVKNLEISKFGKTYSNKIKELSQLINSSKGCIIADPDAIHCSSPEKLMNAILNVLILSENPDGFVPYYEGGNDQGICDMGAISQHLPGYSSISNLESIKKLERLWGTKLPREKGKRYSEMFKDKLKALYLTDTIPEEKLGKIEFLVIQDIYPNKIMNKADVVLPARAFTEDDGTVTSLERRVQKIKQAVKEPEGARSDWKIICNLARKMDAKGFDYKNFQQIFKEIKEIVPFISGMGIWKFGSKQPTLFPLMKTGEMKDLTSSKPLFRYRGADLMERVDDFRIQMGAGGK